jgi:hypothetical protein
MRALLLIVIIAVVALLIALASGFLSINQTRGAKPPEVTATRNGVTAKGGQAPAFDVETGSVKVGAKETKVKVPALVVQKPTHNQATAATANAQ